eukprot:TRINITY_DN5736_c0_g3_i1.p3 TRINITY_DN5736_c0_g3~~TRINITY_DN5736_c0_g3_i1.p3  ORF type:complete len:172 (-),score=60.39 TRINITY_DN5736_c0_g3_i1:60-530(-)
MCIRDRYQRRVHGIHLMQESGFVKTQEFGKNVKLYTLRNKAGCELDLLDYGATIRSIRVPDKQGKLTDVTLGFNTLEEYEKCTSYIGCTVGRTAGRIQNGTFVLNGKTIVLSKNEKGITTLHGGFQGFNRKIWKATIIPGDIPKITMEYNLSLIHI